MFKKKLFKKRLFRKSNVKVFGEEFEDNTPKVKMKKKTIIIIEIICAVLIFGVLLGVKYLITNKVDENIVYMENQVVNNITFTDFSLTYEDEISDVYVNMINYTAEDIVINKLTIRLYASDNTKVSEITVDYLTNGGALTIGKNQASAVENRIKLDLTDITKVEYVLE